MNKCKKTYKENKAKIKKTLTFAIDTAGRAIAILRAIKKSKSKYFFSMILGAPILFCQLSYIFFTL